MLEHAIQYPSVLTAMESQEKEEQEDCNTIADCKLETIQCSEEQNANKVIVEVVNDSYLWIVGLCN